MRLFPPLCIIPETRHPCHSSDGKFCLFSSVLFVCVHVELAMWLNRARKQCSRCLSVFSMSFSICLQFNLHHFVVDILEFSSFSNCFLFCWAVAPPFSPVFSCVFRIGFYLHSSATTDTPKSVISSGARACSSQLRAPS